MNINRSRATPAAWADRLRPHFIQVPRGIGTQPATICTKPFAPQAAALHPQLRRTTGLLHNSVIGVLYS